MWTLWKRSYIAWVCLSAFRDISAHRPLQVLSDLFLLSLEPLQSSCRGTRATHVLLDLWCRWYELYNFGIKRLQFNRAVRLIRDLVFDFFFQFEKWNNYLNFQDKLGGIWKNQLLLRSEMNKRHIFSLRVKNNFKLLKKNSLLI